MPFTSDEGLRATRKTTVSATAARKDEHALFTEAGDAKRTGLWNRILAKSVLLGDVACVNFGKQLRDRKKYPKDVIKVDRLKGHFREVRPCYTGRDVFRYRLGMGTIWPAWMMMLPNVAGAGIRRSRTRRTS